MNPPSNHHWLPQFMMSPWDGTDSQVQWFTAFPHKVYTRRKSTVSIGSQDALYRIDGHGVVDPDIFETTFSKMENIAALARHKLTSNVQSSLSDDERGAFATMIMFTVNRRPDKILPKIPAAQIRWEEDVRNIYKEEIQVGTFTNEQFTALSRGYGKHLVLRAALDSAVGLGQHIAALKWTVVRFDDERFRLVLADRPIRAWGPSGLIQWLTLPIAPSALLVIGDGWPYMEFNAPSLRETLALKIIEEQFAQAREFAIALEKNPYNIYAQRLMSGQNRPLPQGTL